MTRERARRNDNGSLDNLVLFSSYQRKVVWISRRLEIEICQAASASQPVAILQGRTSVPLVLSAKNNPLYGGSLINQKYTPLENIIVSEEDAAEYRALFTGRAGTLTAISAYPPNALNFYANWEKIGPITSQAPLVVASTNRANWMATILQNAVTHGAFSKGYLTPNTFEFGTVPWYAPGRSKNRQVYVVVHWSEYAYYADTLKAFFPGVAVVGYKFTAPEPVLDIVGFGVSRYCALQLAIKLGYHRAWTVDDNVINVNGFPDLLVRAEGNMTNDPPMWAISFNAATKNVTERERDASVTFMEVKYKFSDMAPGVLQQVVLWNLDLFRPANLNFCPLFLTSNEDISISNFLQQTDRPERIITACRTVKSEPVADTDANAGAAVRVPERRNFMITTFNAAQAGIEINPGTGKVLLSSYITGTVLPRARQPETAAAATQTRAVEQVMAAAAKQGWYPATAFNPYNGAPTVALLAPAVM
jgi:hypothetical protein